MKKLLNIHTEGRDDKNSDEYRFPYEPTPYEVLERLADSGVINAKSTVLDYGCGKGRVEILNSVLAKVLESYYESPRETSLVFYYPSDEYMGALMMVDELIFFDEIDCRDLFPGKDDRERLVIFKVG